MLVGYVRVSKDDGSQLLDPQKDALLAAGVLSESLYEDYASGKNDDEKDSENGRSTIYKILKKSPKTSSHPDITKSTT